MIQRTYDTALGGTTRLTYGSPPLPCSVRGWGSLVVEVLIVMIIVVEVEVVVEVVVLVLRSSNNGSSNCY